MANQFYNYNSGGNTYGIIGAPSSSTTTTTTTTTTNQSSSIYNTNSSRSLAESYFSNEPSLYGAAAASRYLTPSADSISDTYSSIRFNTAHSYGPPGVDLGPTFSPSIYAAGLKRTPSDSLYHQTLLGAHSTIGQTEAWYSANPLAKRLRYESMTSHLPIYPQRPGERDCAFYMQTRTCKYGEACRFDHPIWIPEGGIPDWQEVPPVPCESLPERPGEPDCPYFLKTQRCKFGNNCKFNHPKDSIALPGANAGGDVTILPEKPSEPPCAFYMKTGNCKFGMSCKFHHPKDVQIQSSAEENATGNIMLGDANPMQPLFAPPSSLNTKGLPIRVGVEDCPFYLKTGSCKYGTSCRYNHPDRIAINPLTDAITPTHLTPPTTHFNFGVASPVASLLPTYHPRLNPTTLGLGPTIYPQRPGEPECDYYMKTGICKFATNCKFHHPFDRSAPASSTTESLEPNVKLTLAGLPRREGAIHCPYYMKTGTCKYGATCRFDHPPPGEVMAMAATTATTTATSQGEASSSAVGEAEHNGENV